MKTKLKLCTLASYVIGIMLAIFLTVIYLNFVDPASLLVKESAAVTVFNCVTTILVAALLLVPFFLFKKITYPEKTENTGFVIFSSSVLGFLFAGYFVFDLIMYIKTKLGESNFLSSSLSSQDRIVQILYIAGIILALPTAAYFIAIALKKKLDKAPALCFLSLFPVIWLAIRLIYIFMLNSASVNAAGRKLDIITLCFCVFFFLAQAKLSAPLSEEITDRKNLKIFLATGYCAITTLIISQLPKLLLQVFWLLKVSDTYIINAIYISLFLYITSRIEAVSRSTDN